MGTGLPNATVMELGTQYDMVVVPIDGAGRDKLVSDYPYYAKSVIPANTYNNTEDVEGVFVYNMIRSSGGEKPPPQKYAKDCQGRGPRQQTSGATLHFPTPT